jgi:hypothetical protein
LGGHSFLFLNVSINKKRFFFSEVVTYEKIVISRRSSMKLMIFITPPLFEPPKGKTYHTSLMPSRQVFDGAFFGCNATKREAGEEMHLSRLLIVSSGPFSPVY